MDVVARHEVSVSPSCLRTRSNFRAALLDDTHCPHRPLRTRAQRYQCNQRSKKEATKVTRASQSTRENDSTFGRRQALESISGAFVASLLFPESAFAESLTQNLRAEGLKAEAARAQAEAEARIELDRRREEDEARAKESQGDLLCATPYGVDVVGITQTIGLTGALVAGLSARNRKAEVEALNAKLRTVNQTLRKQARSGITYAPTLSYAPSQANTEMLSSEDMVSMDEEIESETIRDALRSGKAMLKSGSSADASNAMVQFKKALMMSRTTGCQNLERRAMRGIAATKRIKGDFKAAVQDLQEVLEISKRMKDYTGDSDALGTIADIYTEMGDLETAGKYYDMYLDEMNKEFTN
ncbi:hypothetical protein CYMTET_49485 [Cymbomonas tetramitiformis]|uniref:Uncharacterized protein n=1 Tax=Cymbomonas tetramitiformis TaxID=36881 RepID=A0AAE0BRF1_9CHLO|nr:hypothetical protein CYMTET_49485 [Cymbomonas tetramitiformis]